MLQSLHIFLSDNDSLPLRLTGIQAASSLVRILHSLSRFYGVNGSSYFIVLLATPTIFFPIFESRSFRSLSLAGTETLGDHIFQVRNFESIIIQMALEISKVQGKAITGQTIFEVASQIKQNPNGVLTQAIIQLAKQDIHDNGKTDQTSNLIHKTVSEVREDRSDTLDKEATSPDDLFDAFRMSLMLLR